MFHIKVRWQHENEDEPVLLYSELDEARREVRKVEVYSDGRTGFADTTEEHGSTSLGTAPVPELGEIAADPQFVPIEIGRQEFEAVWARRGERLTE